KAEIDREKIIFKSGDKIIKEFTYEEEIYFGTPVNKIIDENGLKPGRKYTFKILDFTTYSLVDTHFEVVGREDVLILGRRLNLWHVKEETDTVIPISVDGWIDEKGNSLKSVSKAGFVNLTSIRMPKEKAQEVSEQNFDIAFSTVIKSNITFENPQEVQAVKFRLSGIPTERIKSLPYDERSQKILELGQGYALIQTSSQIFKEEEAVSLPVEQEEFNSFLKPTSFCQSGDPEIKKTAEEIIGGEKNSWRAAKKIAEWMKKEMASTYDVGFADAREVLRNREGDCSEHTVLAVALLRAAGIPARAAVGIMYGGGIFAYHMWPEVYVGRWIGLDAKWLAMDKKTGEYYTDATHIKLGHSLLDENIFREMAQAVAEIIGLLKLEIVGYSLDKQNH
ncbi:MAG: transglutaminase-like domain-containing protein, partial [Candidatus Aminicenantes bacterium]